MKVQRDALYLFLCHLEWHNTGDIASYKELVAALDDRDPHIREVAESLLHRRSPCPKAKKNNRSSAIETAVVSSGTEWR